MKTNQTQNIDGLSETGEEKTIWKPSILLAEDDQEMRAMLKRLLQDKGYDVETCVDGFELIQHFGSFSQQNLPKQFDLVVSDIRMPGFTGMEILDYVHETGGFPPIMLITAFGDQKTHDRAHNLGVAAIMDKPFDIDNFMETVADILEKKEAGKLNLWNKSDADVDLSPGFPLETVFHEYPEINEIKAIVRQNAEILKAPKVKIIYCRVIISEQQHPYDTETFLVKIILTIPGKVFVVENNAYSDKKWPDLKKSIHEAFEILYGRLTHYIDSVRNSASK